MGLDPRTITPKKLGFALTGVAAATAASSLSSVFGGGGNGGNGGNGSGNGGMQASALLSRERDQLASPALATASSPGTCVVLCFSVCILEEVV